MALNRRSLAFLPIRIEERKSRGIFQKGFFRRAVAREHQPPRRKEGQGFGCCSFRLAVPCPAPAQFGERKGGAPTSKTPRSPTSTKRKDADRPTLKFEASRLSIGVNGRGRPQVAHSAIPQNTPGATRAFKRYEQGPTPPGAPTANGQKTGQEPDPHPQPAVATIVKVSWVPHFSAFKFFETSPDR
jgi:hypothetical protein